jgi:hypothetical protein
LRVRQLGVAPTFAACDGGLSLVVSLEDEGVDVRERPDLGCRGGFRTRFVRDAGSVAR